MWINIHIQRLSFQYSKSQGFIEKHHSQNYSSRTLNPYMSFIRNMIMGHLGTSDCLRHTSLPETLAPWKNSPPTHFKICPMRQFFLNFGCELQWWVVQLSQDPGSLGRISHQRGLVCIGASVLGHTASICRLRRRFWMQSVKITSFLK